MDRFSGHGQQLCRSHRRFDPVPQRPVGDRTQTTQFQFHLIEGHRHGLPLDPDHVGVLPNPRQIFDHCPHGVAELFTVCGLAGHHAVLSSIRSGHCQWAQPGRQQPTQLRRQRIHRGRHIFSVRVGHPGLIELLGILAPVIASDAANIDLSGPQERILLDLHLGACVFGAFIGAP
ncbi:hypothetical protein GFY24_40035 [Nocardia sp. SYP-A9097]|uniref:hypothetical protein n=1 Tax=Nocardia sp. SYP-A9097 TaxID=2663237 RepID=UPI00129B0752|nr:hypothetical protein [Nocardia sp. SYP-A9097]MRH93518.1 hypothetical protein [Nocardia sp. SYP-A9097]